MVCWIPGASRPNVYTLGLARGRLRPPRPPGGHGPDGPAGGGRRPPHPLAVRLMASRRTGQIHLRAAPAEIADWRTKAAAAGVPLSDLLRQAMARTRTWTAAAADAERERTRQVARIGNNLNQLARWANANAAAVDAVEVIAHLVAFERELRKLTRIDGDGGDAH